MYKTRLTIGFRIKFCDKMNKNKNLILIADDHPLFREALINIVDSSFQGFAKTIATAKTSEAQIIHSTDYNETLNSIGNHDVSWLFLDLNMPGSDGLNGLIHIRQQYPDLSIVVISANESPEIIQSCFTYNISGYIPKSTQPDRIEKIIQDILMGVIYSPISLSVQSETVKAKGIESLTASQLKILTYIGVGKLNKQIAEELGITEATVKAHITQIYKKLNVKNRTKAALLAQQSQLVD